MNKIFLELEKLSKKAYCPYSDFAVAAILVTTSGQFFKGVNVENAVFPATICAERVAITQAIASGVEPKTFKEIHIYSPNTDKFIIPCGHCLQVCAEFFSEKVSIFLYNSKSEFSERTLNQLLPNQFNKDFF